MPAASPQELHNQRLSVPRTPRAPRIPRTGHRQVPYSRPFLRGASRKDRDQAGSVHTGIYSLAACDGQQVPLDQLGLPLALSSLPGTDSLMFLPRGYEQGVGTIGPGAEMKVSIFFESLLIREEKGILGDTETLS